jgi:catechol 2,3-dioxygenase-like lactoylglutathione lyase family enzyme
MKVIDHLEIRTRQLDAVVAFYRRVLAPLGYELKLNSNSTGFATPAGPDFFILEGPPSADVHYAFRATDRATVRACYESGRESTGELDREPALAPAVHPHYYAGYLRDPDQRLVEFVCHTPE